jgi:uncharacterized protein
MLRQIKTKSVVSTLIIINVIMFFLQIILGNNFTNLLMLNPNLILKNPLYLFQIFTSMFMHGGFNHLFWNMYGLLMFGQLLENKIGWERFLLVYMTAGIFAGFGHIVLSMFLFGSAPPALGASGAIMGMLGTLIILMPDLRLLFFFFIPTNLRTAGIIWILMDLFGVFIPNGVGNIAHLVGIATGLIFGLYLKQNYRQFNKKFSKKFHITIEDANDYMKNGRI